jgi:4-amino-4-deoxy-L-arabinose transferase-like glycosyltransferase
LKNINFCIKSQKIRFLIVIILPLISGLLILKFSPQEPLSFGDAWEYNKSALWILEGKRDAFIVNEWNVVRPPVYAGFLATIYLFFGKENFLAVQIVQCLLYVFTCLIIYYIGMINFSRLCGFLSAIGVAIYPFFLYYIPSLASENLFLFMLSLTVLWLIKIKKSPKSPYKYAILSGIFLAFTLLCRPNIFLILPFIFLWLLIIYKGQVKKAVKLYLCLTGFLLLIILPWTIFNYVSGKGLFLITNGGGFNFWVGNNSQTMLIYTKGVSKEEYKKSNNAIFNPKSINAELYSRIKKLPFPEQERQWYREGFRFIKNNPLVWIKLLIRKFVHYWGLWVHTVIYPRKIVFISAFSFIPLLLLGGWGLFLSIRKKNIATILFVFLFLSGTLSSMIWSCRIRYRCPVVDPYLLILAVKGMLEIWGKFKEKYLCF